MIHSHRWLVVLAPLSVRDMQRWSNPHQSLPVLQAVLRDPDVIRALRPWWAGVRHRADLHRVSDKALAEDILAAASARLIHVLVSSAVQTGKTGGSAAGSATAPPSAGSPPPASLANMSLKDKVQSVFLKAAALLPSKVGEDLKALVSPASLAAMALAISALAVAQLFGVGEVADVGLAALAWYYGGKAALQGLYELGRSAIQIYKAQSPSDLDKAAQALADAVNLMGVATLTLILVRVARTSRAVGDAGDVPIAKPTQEPDFSRPIARKPVGGAAAPAEVQAAAPIGAAESVEGAGGPYSNLADPPSVGPGKAFTQAQKANIYQQNLDANGGVLRSDLDGEELVMPSKSQAGVTPPSNEAQIDHIDPRVPSDPDVEPGSNSYSNAQVLSRLQNRIKSNN